MIDVIRPPRLQPGDMIAVFTASDPLTPEVWQWVERGIEQLRAMGFGVVTGQTLFRQHYYMAGTPAERWQDLRQFVCDERVKMIMTAMGGENANQLLPLLDYELIRAHPKIITGYSDPTVLLNAIQTRAGLITFYGFHAASFDPLWPWFGQYDRTSFAQLFLEGSTPLRIQPAADRETWRGGVAEGAFVGGCLSDVRKLLGTPYEPDWRNKILILEDVQKKPQHLDVALTHLKQAGVFAGINGLLLGKFHDCVDSTHTDWNPPLSHLFLSITEEFQFPILKTEEFGHFSHICPIPLGCLGRIDATAQTIDVLEPYLEW
ncbi:MAG: LD-carboxypeptidase [Anaerolineales bacterium]|nr:LD-carboxypeptidase [Anaerolineales bacterium]MCB8954679.1 LD-carboxypeptidase [Ardenticatenales bacterium]